MFKHLLVEESRFLYSKNFFHIVDISLGLFLSTALINIGPILAPDTSTYLEASVIRSLGYPLFLKCMLWLFNSQYLGIVITQTFAGITSSYWLAQKILSIYQVRPFLINTELSIYKSNNIKNFLRYQIFKYFIWIILLIPYYGWVHYGNYLSTEGLCYPIFLFFIGFFLTFLIKNSSENYLYSLLCLILLVVIRRQFVFIYSVYLFAFLNIILTRRFVLIRQLKIFGLFLATVLCTHMIEYSYVWMKEGHFSSPPFSGIHFIVAPAFIAEPGDEKIFNDPQEKLFFQTLYKDMQKHNFTSSSSNEIGYYFLTSIERFQTGFDMVPYKLISSALKHFPNMDVYTLDAKLINMGKNLTIQRWKERIILYFKNIGQSFNFFYLAFIFIILISCFIRSFDSFLPYGAVFYVLLFQLGNYGFISLIHHPLKRYTTYTDTVTLAMVSMLCLILIFPSKREDT